MAITKSRASTSTTKHRRGAVRLDMTQDGHYSRTVLFGPSVSAVRTECLALGTNHSDASESNDKQDVRGWDMGGVMLITGREGVEKRLSGAQFSAFVLIVVTRLTGSRTKARRCCRCLGGFWGALSSYPKSGHRSYRSTGLS